jgi:hypothetical protein
MSKWEIPLKSDGLTHSLMDALFAIQRLLTSKSNLDALDVLTDLDLIEWDNGVPHLLPDGEFTSRVFKLFSGRPR